MKSTFHHIGILAALGMTLLAACSTNRLADYQFDKTTAAAIMAAPPRAQVFSDTFLEGGTSSIHALVRAGTAIAKGLQAHEAQKQLDAAMEQVDIPEEIRAGALDRCGAYLNFTPVDEPGGADFTFFMKINRYGIDAESWDARVSFRIEIKVRLVDNQEKRKIWERTLREEMPVSRSFFFIDGTIGDILTASTLADLSEDQMVQGLTALARYAADRIADRIQEDFIDAQNR